MTEDRWLRCAMPKPLLDFLGVKANARKMRLFACALCRSVWDILLDKRSRTAIRKLEDYADDLGNEQLRLDAYNIANAAFLDAPYSYNNPNWSAACAVVCAASPDTPPNLYGNFESAVNASRGLDGSAIRRLETDTLRELFGNPFRPVAFNPEWLTDTVLMLARQMYKSREFSAMPILADALQDAGCDNDDVLNHCRDAKQTHVRGCWVVDLVLGKK